MGVFVVDVTAHRCDRHWPARKEADVDPPIVIAVDQHDVLVRLSANRFRQHLIVESAQRDAVVGLDDDQGIRVNRIDDRRCVLRRDLVARGTSYPVTRYQAFEPPLFG